MRLNERWVFKLIMRSLICFICTLSSVYLLMGSESNIGTDILIMIFSLVGIFYINSIQKEFINGPAYYKHYIIPKYDIEQVIFSNIIVLAHQGRAFVFDHYIKEIANLPNVYAKLYYKRNKEKYQEWHLDPYTQIMRMKESNKV